MDLWLAVLIVFVWRLADIACETLRTILVVNRYKWFPAAVAFVEVFVWIYVFNEVVINHKHWLVYLAYAIGYSLGTILGCMLGQYIIGKKGK